MKYHIVQNPTIKWKIDKDSPEIFELKSLNGYNILNPYHYYSSYKIKDFHGDIIRLNEDVVYMATKILILEKDISTLDYPIESQNLFVILREFLKYLRYVSFQADIGYNSLSLIVSKSYSEKGNKITKGWNRFNNSMLEKDYACLITQKKIVEADKLMSESIDIPIFEEILLDSLEELKFQNFRKSILFSAMAAESFLKEYYELVYIDICQNQESNPNFRIHGIKDSVYEKLKKSPGGFSNLLDSIPLYLLNRSIRLEDIELYEDAKKLYQTRNSLAHKGVLDKSEHLTIDFNGAGKAFETAVKIFSWVGNKKFEKLLSSNEISLI